MIKNQPRVSGICAICMIVLLWLLVIRMYYVEPMSSEAPLELLYLFPIFLVAHILAIVALCTRSKRNRWLGLAALILFWGVWGVMALVERLRA